MSKLLADLLATDHPLFTYNLQQLETATGDGGVDTRLIADITEKAHEIMRSLGIDPADTSAQELYHALNAAITQDQVYNLLKGAHYVLLRFDEGPVSFCLHDVIENAHHNLSFEDRKFDHAQRHLRSEIIKRYAEHDRTDNTLVHNLTEQAGLKPRSDEGFEAVDQSMLAATGETANKNSPSILMVGDIFTDAFIKLDEKYAFVETDKDGNEWLKLPFGSKPPYQEVEIVKSVGPSPNAAIACSRLGLGVSLMTWLGDDQPGTESLAHLKSESVDTSMVVTQENTKSSYWYVLRHGADRTMLVKSEKYRYEWKDPVTQPEWIYLSYTGEDSWLLHEGLLDYLQMHTDVKLVFQPGTYHFEWGSEKLAGIYGRTYLVVMNREEAAQVTEKSPDDLHKLAGALHGLGPEMVIITDGAKGSYASYEGQMYKIPNYPDPAPPLDRTGAGDAFASTITAALALGEPLQEALRWAPINSMSVVQKLGAQAGLLSMDELQGFLASAPSEFVVTKI